MARKREQRAARPTGNAAEAGGAHLINTQLSRAFYLYLNWLEQRLGETRLNRYLKPGMGPILFTLFEEDDVIMKDLVERTRLVPSTVTRTLKKMERTGLVSRSKDKYDGRAVRIRLTRLGRSLEPACRGMQQEAETLLTRGISATQRRALYTGMAKVIENLRDEGRTED